jgi:hypothetical protein
MFSKKCVIKYISFERFRFFYKISPLKWTDAFFLQITKVFFSLISALCLFLQKLQEPLKMIKILNNNQRKRAQYCSCKKLQGHDRTPIEHKGKAASNRFTLLDTHKLF